MISSCVPIDMDESLSNFFDEISSDIIDWAAQTNPAFKKLHIYSVKCSRVIVDTLSEEELKAFEDCTLA